MAPRISPEDVVWAHAGGELCFQRGTVVRLDPHKGTVSVRIKSGIIDAKEADVHKTNSDKQDGVPDNTYLRELNEATLLHNVQYRYDSGDDGGVYSSTGHILIAVNPFRPLKIYEESNVSTLLPRSRWPAASRPALPSHG